MNDILICVRPHGKCLVLGETAKGKAWMFRNMVLTDSSVASTWISREVLDEVVEDMKREDLIVEVM